MQKRTGDGFLLATTRSVEALVKIARRTFFVLTSKVLGFDSLNDRLEAGCLARLDKLAEEEALMADLDALRPLPAVPFDPCEQRAGRASSLPCYAIASSIIPCQSPTCRYPRPAAIYCSKSSASATNASTTIVTSNLPFQEWTSAFASERLPGAPLDRITQQVHILEMNAESYRLKQSRTRKTAKAD